MNLICRDKIRILCIEDDPIDVRIIKNSLKNSEVNHDLDEANCLKNGLSKLRNQKFDVVLSDLGLPGTSGIEVVQKLREEFPSAPLIVLTALEDERVLMQALDSGAQDYLIKSELAKADLHRVIRHAILRQQNGEMRQILSQLSENEKELSKKNEHLKELNEIALQFVDNVSHEFRTPLTVIKEYVSLMADGLTGEVNDEQARLLRTVEDRANDLNNMVNDMLDVSKLNAGSLSISRKGNNLKQIVEQILPSLQAKADLRQVNLQFGLADDLPELFCDGEKVGRILINLIVNAIKFCGTPGQVYVSSKHDAQRGEIKISVADNGNGIPADKLAHIFERFSQIRTEFHSHSTKGFGLGLNIVKELVDLNFGEINVSSEAGQGSIFNFTVPCNQPEQVIQKYLNACCKFAGDRHYVVFSVSMPHFENDRQVADTDALLEEYVNSNDLIYQLNQNHWLLFTNMSDSDASDYISRFEDLRQLMSRNRPMGPLADVVLKVVGNFELGDEPEAKQIPEVVQELIQDVRQQPDHVKAEPSLERESVCD